MSVWKYVCAQRLEKQMNATVPLVVWYRRWSDKESAETRANIYQRKSCKSHINTLPTDNRLIGFLHRRLPTDSPLIGFLSLPIFLLIWTVICYLVLRYLAQLPKLRCFVSSHSFIPIWKTYLSRWTKRMVLESLNRNRAGARRICVWDIGRTCVCCWVANSW